MTKEEMAEEYADRTRIVDENTKAGTDCISLVQDYEGNYIDIHERIKQAYLAGLKAGRPKWHDLRKDPNDLPEERGNYILCFIGADGSNGAGKRCKTIAFFDPEFMEWSEEDNLDDIPYFRNKKVLIAWCEIPKYTEE